jgi:hypothetical protein
MAFYINPSAIDAELAYVKDACTEIVIVVNYLTTHTRANVLNGTNVLASITNFLPTDFQITASGLNRQLTSPAAKSDTTANNTGSATHIVFLSNTDVLLAVPLTPQVITAGNTVNFPVVTYTSYQPTS